MPEYVEIRWISLRNVLRWLEAKNSLKEFLDPVELGFTKLQGRTTTLTDQETEFKQLQEELADIIVAIKMNFSTQTQGNEDDVQAEDWKIMRPNAVDLLCNLSLWVR